MPSQARRKFDENAADVASLVDMYGAMEILWKDDPENFPEGTEVLFRSAVVLLVSHWEAYVEDICSEALQHLVTHSKTAETLPKAVKQEVAAEIRNTKDDLAAWKLSDGGWRELLLARLENMKEGRDRGFNTPKSSQTQAFVRACVGIEDVTKSWTIDDHAPSTVARKLDALVAMRGEIAHRGRIKTRLDEAYVTDHLRFMGKLVSKTGGAINSHLKKHTKKPLWKPIKKG